MSIQPLPTYGDVRSSLTQLYRGGRTHTPPEQWNFSRSEANVIRGVHVHVTPHDYMLGCRWDDPLRELVASLAF